MLGQTLAAWVLLPIVAVALALGLSLLLESATKHELGLLRVPVGLCAAICLTLGVLWIKVPGGVAVAVVVAAALAGLVLGRRRLREGCSEWLVLGWLAAYGLHMAPVVLWGEWTWLGYNFVNDTATQLLLADHLLDSGLAAAEVAQPTTATEVVRIYLATSYPVGSHALLGTLGELVPASLAAIYQPYVAVLAASGSLCLTHLLRRVGMSTPAAAAAGVLAVGANLFYQYALQGNVKEIAFFMALAAAAATGREVIASERPLAASAAASICFAAAFVVYSAAAAPYLLALGVALCAAGLWGRRASIARLTTAGAALGVGALLLALPALAGALTFNRVASGTFASENKAVDLGHLLRPLEKIQVAGVWLVGDYRVPVPESRELITTAVIVVIAALTVMGVAWALRRREPAPLILMAVTLVAATYLVPRLSPYAGGKVLALASPVAVMGACLGAWALAARWRAAGALAAVLMAAGILWSDALAYHDVKLAPIDRMEALEEVGEQFSDTRGLVLYNEPEEFAKVYSGGAPINGASEAITPKQIQLRAPQNFQARYFDLDEQLLSYVQDFAGIVKRRSPSASRPPSNFRLVFVNDWYEGWRRDPKAPRVLDHLPLQGVHSATGVPACSAVIALAKRAVPGDRLVAASRRAMPRLDTAAARRSFAWAPHPYLPGMVVTPTPGTAAAQVLVKAPGRFRAWVAGSFTRPIEVFVDGRRVGAAEGVNNLGQWLPAGTITLEPGRHRLALLRGGGDLTPGDGYSGELGPLVLEPLERPTSLVDLRPRDAGKLCGRPWDWIELVRPQRGSST